MNETGNPCESTKIWSQAGEWLEEGGDPSARILPLWQKFHALLVDENTRHNLTRIISLEDAVLKHYMDSWLIFRVMRAYFGPRKISSMLDFGCGGGFPGIPIALGYPELKLFGVDARNKKVDFVNRVMQELSVRGRAFHANWKTRDAQKFARAYGRVDVSVARAVAQAGELVGILAPTVSKGIVLTKGPGMSDEELLEASRKAQIAGLRKFYEETSTLRLGDSSIERRILFFLR